MTREEAEKKLNLRATELRRSSELLVVEYGEGDFSQPITTLYYSQTAHVVRGAGSSLHVATSTTLETQDRVDKLFDSLGKPERVGFIAHHGPCALVYDKLNVWVYFDSNERISLIWLTDETHPLRGFYLKPYTEKRYKGCLELLRTL